MNVFLKQETKWGLYREARRFLFDFFAGVTDCFYFQSWYLFGIIHFPFSWPQNKQTDNTFYRLKKQE